MVVNPDSDRLRRRPQSRVALGDRVVIDNTRAAADDDSPVRLIAQAGADDGVFVDFPCVAAARILRLFAVGVNALAVVRQSFDVVFSKDIVGIVVGGDGMLAVIEIAILYKNRVLCPQGRFRVVPDAVAVNAHPVAALRKIAGDDIDESGLIDHASAGSVDSNSRATEVSDFHVVNGEIQDVVKLDPRTRVRPVTDEFEPRYPDLVRGGGVCVVPDEQEPGSIGVPQDRRVPSLSDFGLPRLS